MSRKKILKIELPEPCGENWEAMIPMGCGRFCAGCGKTVIDFSSLPDSELVRILSEKTTGLCGHFTKQQLNREIRFTESRETTPVIHFTKKIAAALLLVPTLSQSLFAQKPHKKVSVAKYPVDSVTANQVCIQGTITDVITGKPLAGMAIDAGLAGSAYSDKSGHFSLVIPSQLAGQKITFSASYQAASSPEHPNTIILQETMVIDALSKDQYIALMRYPMEDLSFNDGYGSLKIEADAPEAVIHTMGGAPVVSRSDVVRPGLWHRIKWTFRKKR